MSKIILAFDTAMSACSAAVFDGEESKALSQKHEAMQRGQAERLVPLIDEVMKEAGIDYKDLDLITCTRGPGAFTGLRLSLATARTFSLSLNIPAIGVSTLETIAGQSPETDKKRLICLETKRKDYYTQLFSPERTSIDEAKCLNTSDVADTIREHEPLVIGDANERLFQELTEIGIPLPQISNVLHPDCTILAQLAYQKYQENGERLQDMEPLYLRDADVSFPATKK